MAETGPFVVHVRVLVREEHEWVSRAGGLFRFVYAQLLIDGRPSSRIVILVTDLDGPENP